jgi:phage terminase large subunit-like protein
MGEWSQWVALAGRGWGKSRVGKEWVREEVNAGARRFALVGATNSDVRNVMIEGSAESPGLLDVFPDHQRPVYIPSKRLIKFHTGAVGYTYSAETPARLRGPQHDRA